MIKYFSVGEAAKIVGVTSETLRHYDRIGLVKPSKKDEWTKYRYYSEQDIVRLNTIRALRQMGLPLQEIKRVLDYDNLEKVIDFLKKAEKTANKKIAALQYSRSKIQLAIADYERKLQAEQKEEAFFTKAFPERVILLSDTLDMPSLDNLWNYLNHFYEKVAPSQRDLFSFEDLAGIYTEKGFSRLFAVCIHYTEMKGLKILPAGTYLCADCTEQSRALILDELVEIAKIRYHAVPEFVTEMVVVAGILQWKYQIQVLIEKI